MDDGPMEGVKSAARWLARVLRRAANRLDVTVDTQTWVMKHPRRDMADDPDERHYELQYLRWLEPFIAGLPSGATVLDLGCGYGRLALAIAGRRPDCAVVGVDHSPPSIRGARAHAAERRLPNCRFEEADLAEFLSRQDEASADLVLFVEVSFFAPRELGVLPQCARVLRPGAHLFGAFRSQWFNLVHSIVARDLRSARIVCDARDGRLWGGGHRLWWQTPAEIQQAFTVAGLTMVAPCRGVGVLSALREDGVGLVQPASLSDEERSILLDLELSLAEAYAAQGRYIVGVGRK